MRGDQVATAVELVGVSKSYGETTALTDVDVAISPGELLVLLGPSGCGKSTVLKIVAGLEDATEGEVYIGGRLVNYVAPKARDVAMVFQNYALYPHMTVEANIGFPLKMTGHPKQEVRVRVEEAARLLELEPELTKYPEQLSGGQRQRVALGRAIVRDPVAFLMDEPLSNLDALLRVQMRDELLALHRRIGRTTLYVTHDQFEALTMADRIVVLRAGVVQQVGTPDEIYREPANTFVAGFVGTPRMNLLSGLLERNGAAAVFVRGDVRCRLGTVESSSREVMLGLRPEDLELTGEDADVRGRVVLVQPAGADVFVTVSIGQRAEWVARVRAGTRVREGESVGLSLAAERAHVFDADGVRIPPAADSVQEPRGIQTPGLRR